MPPASWGPGTRPSPGAAPGSPPRSWSRPRCVSGGCGDSRPESAGRSGPELWSCSGCGRPEGTDGGGGQMSRAFTFSNSKSSDPGTTDSNGKNLSVSPWCSESAPVLRSTKVSWCRSSLCLLAAPDPTSTSAGAETPSAPASSCKTADQ